MVKNEEEDICPWDSWLKFRKPRLEREFLVGEYRSYCRTDLVFFAMLMAVWPARCLACWARGASRVRMLDRAIELGMMMVLPVLYWCCKQRRWPYGSYQERQNFVFWLRIVFFVVVAMETPKALVEESNLLMMCLSRGAIVLLFVTSVCLRLPFQNLVASQCIEALILVPWIACLTGEDSSGSVAAAVDKVAGITDLLCFTIPIGLKGRHLIWWRVGTFYHILLGLVLPLALLYVVEAWSRAKFVKSTNMSFSPNQISSFFKDTVGCVAFVVVLVIQLLWVTLTKI